MNSIIGIISQRRFQFVGAFVLTLFFAFSSCEFNLPEKKKKELAVITQIKKFYDCTATYEKKEVLGPAGPEDVHILKLQGKVFKEYGKMLEIPASNIALMFYDFLPPANRKFKSLSVQISKGKGAIEKFDFQADELNALISFVIPFHRVMLDIQDRHYHSLSEKFDKDIVQDASPEIVHQRLYELDSTYRTVDAITVHGFIRERSKDGKEEIIKCYGVLHYIKQPIQLQVVYRKSNMKIVMLGFDWNY